MVKKLLVILFGIFLMLFNCSCIKKENISKYSSSEIFISSKTKPIYLLEENEKNLISIKLPTDYKFNNTQIEFMTDFLLLKLYEISGENFKLINSEKSIKNDNQNYTDYYITIDSKTSYASDDIISIVFRGFLNKKSAAHPMHIFFALNFDPRTMSVVDFSSRHIIDDALYNEFASQAEKQILEENEGKWPENLGAFSETLCPKECFFEGLKSEEYDFLINWYYTETSIGFSYSVPFALGNYKVVELRRVILKNQN